MLSKNDKIIVVHIALIQITYASIRQNISLLAVKIQYCTKSCLFRFGYTWLMWNVHELFMNKIDELLSGYAVNNFFFSSRYMAIMNPLRPRMGKRLTLGIAAGIWIGGVILSMPMLIFFQTFQQENSTTVVCYSEWPDGPQTESHQEYL